MRFLLTASTMFLTPLAVILAQTASHGVISSRTETWTLTPALAPVAHPFKPIPGVLSGFVLRIRIAFLAEITWKGFLLESARRDYNRRAVLTKEVYRPPRKGGPQVLGGVPVCHPAHRRMRQMRIMILVWPQASFMRRGNGFSAAWLRGPAAAGNSPSNADTRGKPPARRWRYGVGVARFCSCPAGVSAAKFQERRPEAGVTRPHLCREADS